jgi:hypothetical protein
VAGCEPYSKSEGAPAPRVDWRAAERQTRQMLADWRHLLAGNISDARPILRLILEGSLTARLPTLARRPRSGRLPSRVNCPKGCPGRSAARFGLTALFAIDHGLCVGS